MAAAAAGFPLFILPYENITVHQFRHDQKIGCLALSHSHFYGRLSSLSRIMLGCLAQTKVKVREITPRNALATIFRGNDGCLTPPDCLF